MRRFYIRRSRDGGNGGSEHLILGGPEVEPALFRQIRAGDPALPDRTEGHIENTETGCRFVPKVKP